MATTYTVSRAQLVYGLCLPLAVLLGYLLAEPLESSSLAVVVLVLSVLAVPLLIRWYHPLLVVCWNATIIPYFLPSRPYIWMVMAFVSLFFAVLNRSVNPGSRFLSAPTVARPLLVLWGVMVATAMVTGGAGIRALGSETYGGKGYIYLTAAIVGYFALTSRAVPLRHARLYIAMFLLSALTAVVSNLAYMGGPKFWFLYALFPPEFALEQAAAEGALGGGLVRLAGLMCAAQALFWFLLARFGIRGVFDLARPWRLLLFLGATGGSLLGGYRSTAILLGLTFLVLFFVEGLWRTRFLVVAVCLGMLVTAGLLLFANRMPLSVQRALSFLPIRIDTVTREGAEASSEWRIEMWRQLLPEVPKHLLKGKGYAINPQELIMINDTAARGQISTWEVAAIAGDYHNGPLSVVIPFGIWGVAAFLWFLGAGSRALYANYRFGRPELRKINAFLLTLFIARILFFMTVFGALQSDLYYFTGLIGLSVALNGGVQKAEALEASIPAESAVPSAA